MSFVVKFILLDPVVLVRWPVRSRWPPMSLVSLRILISSSGCCANRSFLCASLQVLWDPNAKVLLIVALEPIWMIYSLVNRNALADLCVASGPLA